MDTENRQHIMVVDDNAGVRVCLQRALEQDGYAVSTADTAENALSALQSRTDVPDLVILDLNMPGIGGMGFLRQTAGPDGLFRYPVLVLSARDTARDFLESAGVVHFIAKPCSETAILSKVQDLVPKPAEKPAPPPRAHVPARAPSRPPMSGLRFQAVLAATRLSELGRPIGVR